MGKDSFKLFLFYCWRLKIKTLGQLAEFKAEHNAKTNSELLNALCKACNR